MIIAVMLWLLCGFVGAAMLSGRNQAGIGCLLGGLLGPLGLLVALCMLMERDGAGQCPHCYSRIDPRATVCPQCRRTIMVN